MIVPMKLLSPQATLPCYATAGAAAMDLSACLPDGQVTLAPGERKLVPTGVAMSIPPLHVGLLFARSGLAAKKGLTLANAVGVIDSDYRGEIKVAMIHLGQEPVTIRHGDRIAQMSILPIVQAVPTQVGELDDTLRSAGGFGSTGVGGL